MGYAQNNNDGGLLCRQEVVPTALFLRPLEGCKKWSLRGQPFARKSDGRVVLFACASFGRRLSALQSRVPLDGPVSFLATGWYDDVAPAIKSTRLFVRNPSKHHERLKLRGAL